MKKPTIEEIAEYCRKRKNGVDPEYFWHYNESRGWVVGKARTPMKSWKSAIITWEIQSKRFKNNASKSEEDILYGEHD
jgi:hypothetical protein